MLLRAALSTENDGFDLSVLASRLGGGDDDKSKDPCLRQIYQYVKTLLKDHDIQSE